MSTNIDKEENNDKNKNIKDAYIALFMLLGCIALLLGIIGLIWGAVGIINTLRIIAGFFALVAVIDFLSQTDQGFGYGIVCGIIAFLILCGANQLEETIYEETRPTYESSSEKKPPYIENNVQNKENTINEEQEKYWGRNRLVTGDRPYKNHKAIGNGKSEIKIKTSVKSESDVVVIIKQQDKIIRNVYIRKGDSYTIGIPNGKYQVFFYYGRGWNPEKKMGPEQIGGFISDENYQKDKEVSINNQILEYSLILQYDGNFRTLQSNKKEMFQ